MTSGSSDGVGVDIFVLAGVSIAFILTVATCCFLGKRRRKRKEIEETRGADDPETNVHHTGDRAPYGEQSVTNASNNEHDGQIAIVSTSRIPRGRCVSWPVPSRHSPVAVRFTTTTHTTKQSSSEHPTTFIVHEEHSEVHDAEVHPSSSNSVRSERGGEHANDTDLNAESSSDAVSEPVFVTEGNALSGVGTEYRANEAYNADVDPSQRTPQDDGETGDCNAVKFKHSLSGTCRSSDQQFDTLVTHGLNPGTHTVQVDPDAGTPAPEQPSRDTVAAVDDNKEQLTKSEINQDDTDERKVSDGILPRSVGGHNEQQLTKSEINQDDAEEINVHHRILPRSADHDEVTPAPGNEKAKHHEYSDTGKILNTANCELAKKDSPLSAQQVEASGAVKKSSIVPLPKREESFNTSHSSLCSVDRFTTSPVHSLSSSDPSLIGQSCASPTILNNCRTENDSIRQTPSRPFTLDAQRRSIGYFSDSEKTLDGAKGSQLLCLANSRSQCLTTDTEKGFGLCKRSVSLPSNLNNAPTKDIPVEVSRNASVPHDLNIEGTDVGSENRLRSFSLESAIHDLNLDKSYSECSSLSVANDSSFSNNSSISDTSVSQLRGSSVQGSELMDENSSSSQPDSDEEWCPQRSSTFRQKDAAFARQRRGQRAEQHSDAGLSGAATLFSGGGLSKEALNDLTANLLDTYTTSTSTQTSPKDKENPPLPCFGADWQFSKEMSSLGGSLQREASDVRLEVPAEAVPASTFVTIKCAISVDIAQVYRKLELCEGEFVVSPIAEYYVRRGFVFQSPVQIVLPHFLPHGFRTESVNVYRFNCDHFENFTYKKLPLRSKDNVDGSHDDQNVPSSDCFYFGNDGHICIMTSHFSGYVCTYCGSHFPACDLHVEVYAKHEEKDRGGRQAKVRLEIWDSRLFIKDFRESRNSTRNQRGAGLNHNMELKDRKTLAALAPSVEVKDVFVGARLDVFSEGGTCGWQHKHRPGSTELCFPVQSTMELKRFVPCKCQSHIPEVVDWLLTNQSYACGIISDVFEFVVDVGYVTSADRNADGRLKYLSDPSKVTFHESVSKTMATLNHTSDMAFLGQELGFPETYPCTIKNDLSTANNNHNLQSPPKPKPPFGKPLPSGPCQQRDAIGELQSKSYPDRERLNTATTCSGQLTAERAGLEAFGNERGSTEVGTAAKYVVPLPENCCRLDACPQNSRGFSRIEQPAAAADKVPQDPHCCGRHNTHTTLRPPVSAVSGEAKPGQPLLLNRPMVCSCQSLTGRAPEDRLVQPTPDGSLPPVMNITCHRMDNVVLNLVSPQQGELQPRTDPDPDSTAVKSLASAKNNWCGGESSASGSSPVQCQDDPYPRTTSVPDALDSHTSDSTC